MRIGIMASHVVQYQAPLFRELAKLCELHVFFAHRQTPQQQAAQGFGTPFEWDIDLLSGYQHTFLENIAFAPDTSRFGGCDTPAIRREVARGFDAFVVMGWHLKCYWQAVRACRKHGVPVMVRGDSQLGTARPMVKRAAKRLLYPRMLRQFDACLVVGQRHREYLAHYGVPEERMFSSPHCVDNAAFGSASRASSREHVRARWGIARAAKVILFAGKLVPGKRPQDLIAAAAMLKERPTIVWAGDGPQRAELEKAGAALDVPMHFLGFCNQAALPEVYAAADVLALPSEAETWGLVVNEAMACGLPCVVSEACGCVPDMVIAGTTGAVHPVGDTASLAEGLRRVLMGDFQPARIAGISDAHSPRIAAQGVLHACTWLKGTA